MTVNINAANISSVQLAAAQTPSAPSAGFVRLHHNANSRLAMRPATGNVVEFLGNTSGSGAGITFPATQSPSTDANTLDDYEEGTWTPVLSGSTGSAGSYTATTAAGRYTKIGRVVSITAGISLSDLGSWTGELQCSLPTIANADSAYGNDIPRGPVRMQFHTFTGQVSAEIITSTRVRFNLTTSGAGLSSMQYSALSATVNNFVNFSLVYETTT